MASIEDDTSNKITLEYDEDKLLSASDGLERKLTFEYSYDESRITCALMTEIILPDGKIPIVMDYDEDGRVGMLIDFYYQAVFISTNIKNNPAAF